MITIRLVNPDNYTRRTFEAQDGNVYLDIEQEQFALRLTKALEALTDVTQLTQEAALAQSLPYTPVNLAATASYRAHTLEPAIDPIEIEVFWKGTRLTLDRMQVVKFDDRANNIEVELLGDSWINDMKRVVLAELDLGSYDYTLANVLATWADPTALAYPLLAHFGGWLTAPQATRKDLRFIFNAYKLMQAAFCSVGWTFASPYYETIGSQVALYLSPENWYTYGDKQTAKRVELNLAAPRAISGPAGPEIFDVVSDPSNIYNNVLLRPGEYFYPATTLEAQGDLQIFVSFKVVLQEATSTRGQFIFLIYRNRVTTAGSNLEFIAFEIIQGPGQGEGSRTYEINFTAVDNNIGGSDSYGLFIGYSNEDSLFYDAEILEASVIFSPNPPHYVDDDNIPLARLIDTELNALDLFKDLAKMINGKIKTDPITRTVTLYPPFDTVQLDQDLTGFFMRDAAPIDLSNQVDQDSIIEERKGEQQPRYYNLSFADAQDSYITERSGQEQPYSRLVDIGRGKNETDDSFKLDLLQPTLEVKTDPSEIGDSITTDTPFLPALWDNVDGEPSKDIGPRVLYVYGRVEQVQDNGTTYEVNFEGSVESSLGYASQSPTRPRATAQDNVRLIFKEDAEDLYRLFYQRYLQEFVSLFDIEVLVLLDQNKYLEIDFRKPVGLFYREAYYIYQVVNIRDFDLSEKILTPVKMRLLNC